MLLDFMKLDCSSLTPTNLILPKFRLILCTFTFVKLNAVSVISSNISSPKLDRFFPHQSLLMELTQFCPHGLARQIYKTHSSVSFRDFLTQQSRRMAAHAA